MTQITGYYIISNKMATNIMDSACEAERDSLRESSSGKRYLLQHSIDFQRNWSNCRLTHASFFPPLCLSTSCRQLY